jgi:D-xylose transport system substrate-binding protein
MKKLLFILILLFAAGAAIVLLNNQLDSRTARVAGPKPVVIGFSLGTTREERWFKDRDLFVAKAKALGAVVDVAMTDYDVTEQIYQIENLVSQGVSVIVVVPADSEKLAPAIAAANAAGVKIIAYDRLIKNSDINMYVSFDSVKVGEMEAASVLARVPAGKFAYIGGAPTDNNASLLKQGTMNILASKIQNGEINLVVDKFMDGWNPDQAYRTIKEYLQTGGALDAVIAANDGTAFGVIQALKEKGLAGRIPVSGQDAELSACQRVIAGTQTSTVYKPIASLADKAAEIAVALARDETPVTTGSINNGQRDVPSYLLEPILVTKDNMQDTVIKDGFHSYAEVYQSGVKP